MAQSTNCYAVIDTESMIALNYTDTLWDVNRVPAVHQHSILDFSPDVANHGRSAPKARRARTKQAGTPPDATCLGIPHAELGNATRIG